MIGSDVNRMCAMLSVIDDVDVTLQREILGTIKENLKLLDEASKAKLWNKSKDFIHKHRRFSDATWALGEERLADIEELVSELIPDDSRLNAIRLFRQDQYSLLMDRDNYSEEEQRIKQEQISAIEVIYHNGLDYLAEFIDSVENKRVAGARASAFLKDNEIRFFIVHSTNVDQDEFLEGLMTAFSFEKVRLLVIFSNL